MIRLSFSTFVAVTLVLVLAWATVGLVGMVVAAGILWLLRPSLSTRL